MTDTGLSTRLRQHSRRSGLVVGLTMAATIALCILSSAYVFGKIEPYVAEVTGYDEPTAVPQVASDQNDPQEDPEEGDATGNDASAAESGSNSDETEGSQPTIAEAETDESDAFEVSHRSNPDYTINFRPGPSVTSGDPIGSLDPNTPLMYLGEDALDEGGVIWLKFRTESGTEGWVREVDTVVAIQ
ncbi:MAG: SH3 domain-containing protein [Thermomicrobiales bacterium]|nr:SH3 domain-containing protein [Thermomicrobiales bacterium]